MADTPRVIEVEMGEDMDMPAEGPKYPWQDLQARPGKGNFVLRGYQSKLEAQQAKASIYSSGANYFSGRDLNFAPVVRLYPVEGTNEWYIRTWVKVTEGAGDEE